MNLKSEHFFIQTTNYGKFHDIQHLQEYSKQRLMLTKEELEDLSSSIIFYLQELDQCCGNNCGRCGDWEL